MASYLRSFALLALIATSACSTIVEGTTQKVTVNSSPQGAQCLFREADSIVARVTTPGTAEIPKSKNDLVILCSKDGYESATVNNRSDLAIASLGNAAFYELSFLGNAVDSASGASNKYDSKVNVTLTPAQMPAAFPTPPGATVVSQVPPESVAAYSMQAPMPAPAPAALTAPDANPAIHAALRTGDAARSLAEPKEVAELSYAQQMAAVSSQPPFGVIQ